MNHEQHGTDPGFNLSRADRMPALFFRFTIEAVRIHEALLVFEDQRRQLE